MSKSITYVDELKVSSSSRPHKRGRKRAAPNSSLAGDGATFNVLSQALPRMKFRFPDNVPYKFVQFNPLAFGTITSSAVAVVNTAQSFTTSNITQFAAFAAIFDQYWIKEVEYWLIPRNPTTTGSTAAANRGTLATVVDYDNTTALSVMNDYGNYSNCVVSSAIQGQYRRFRPHQAVATYGSGVFTSFMNVPSTWNDCTSTSVAHYGVKIGISPADAAADVVVYDQHVRLHVWFRNTI